MQTFLPYSDIYQSAKCLDNKRLGKQRVEAKQILKALRQGQSIMYNIASKEYEWGRVVQNEEGYAIKKTPWYVHPAVQMWKGYELDLAEYGFIMCTEWRKRGYEDNLRLEFRRAGEKLWHRVQKKGLPRFMDQAFHDSHKSRLLFKGWVDAYVTVLTKKYGKAYNKWCKEFKLPEKNKINGEQLQTLKTLAQDTNDTPINWYSQFNWDVPENLPYKWK